MENISFKSRFSDARELTNGHRSEGTMTLEPMEKGPPEHIHLNQMEFFEVITGELTIMVNGKKIIVKKGERVVINKSERHTYLNNTLEKVAVKFGYEPALNIQWMLDTFEKNEKGMGGNWSKFPILEMGFVLYSLRNEYRLAKLPFWMQDVVFGTLSKLAEITNITKKIQLPENLK